MIRQIDVKTNSTDLTASASGKAKAKLKDDLSVTYGTTENHTLFKDFKIRPGLLLTVSDKPGSQGSKTVHETQNAPVSLGFNLSHRIRCTLNTGGKRTQIFERSPGTCVLSHLPKTRCIIETPPEKRILGVSVHFSQAAFKALFSQVPPYLEDIFTNTGSSSCLYRQSRFDSQIASILNQITACPYQGEIQRIFLEAKALELVALTLSAMDQKRDDLTLNRQETERVRRAYHILSSRIDDPLTLEELGRATGLNRNKLNTGFKHLYGRTVFNVLRDLRLYRARDLLCDSEKSLVDIALSVGYSNQANFTTAFRRQFGKTPLALRREKIFWGS